jgi:serine protease SohB
LRQRYGDKVRMPVITAERGLLGRWIPGLSSLQALTRRPGFADEVISALEARALWGRYGL